MPYTDVNLMGLSTANSGEENRRVLQEALDKGGTVCVTAPGVYDISDTVYIGSNTTLEFANGAALRKVKNAEGEGFAQVILNRGALTRTWDEHIIVRGVKILVENVWGQTKVPGLRGHLAFHYVKNLVVDDIRLPDLEPRSYGIHICTFEDIRVTNCVITGMKDGVHLGRGRRFYIADCVFDTYDDAIGLNGHDYDTGNPQLGFIEDGVIERCYDVDSEKSVGFFCRILAGAWRDWYEGIEVQKSDSVVSEGRLYRVFAEPDGKTYVSKTRPTHKEGHAILDGIDWVMVQDDATYAAGVCNVTFRDIYLFKRRISFSVHFDRDTYSRSYYPGADHPLQKQLVFDNIRVLHDGGHDFLQASTPIDSILVINSSLRDNKITFINRAELPDLGKTRLTFRDCTSTCGNIADMVQCTVAGKEIEMTVDGEKVPV